MSTGSKRPIVLLVGPWPPTVGGVTSFMLKLEASVVGRKVDFRRFTTSRPPKRGTIDNWGYGAVLRGGVGRMAAGAGVTAWHMAAFPAAVAGVDVVQVQASDFLTFWESAYYVVAAQAMGRPVLMRLGGAFDQFYAASPARVQGAIRAVLRRPDRLIVQSGYWRDLMARLGRHEGVVVVPNWVPDALTAPVERPERAVTVLFIAGTEARRKGIETVLAAARELPGVRWRIVAAPALPGLANLVTGGVLGREAMAAAMRDADVFVLPSRGEGFPNSLIEAMALGLPCVATPVGAVPEILGECGTIVPVDDVGALAGAVAGLARDRVGRLAAGEAAREVVVARYTESRVAGVLRGLYGDRGKQGRVGG